MGSFEEDKDIIKQNLECVTERPDAVFGIRMLMEDKCEMPDRERVQDVMDRHLGRSECFCYDAQVIGFSASQYSVHFAKENKDISPQLLIMGCKPITAPVMDGMEKSQTWDCPECDDILQQCTWQVAASDMMAAGLNYKERAEMLRRSPIGAALIIRNAGEERHGLTPGDTGRDQKGDRHAKKRQPEFRRQ